MKQKAPQTGKTQVQFKIPPRTVFNLSHPVYLDTKPGVINMLNSFLCVSRQRYEFNIRALIKTVQSKAPIMGSFLARVYSFIVPLRLYMPELRLNDMTAQVPTTGARNFTDALLPQYRFPLPSYEGDERDYVYVNPTVTAASTTPESVETPWQVHPGSLLEQVGFAQNTFINPQMLSFYGAVLRRLYAGDSIDDALAFAQSNYEGLAENLPENPSVFDATRILAYYDIFRNYFANPNERGYPVFLNDLDGNDVEKFDPSGNFLPFESTKFSAVGARPNLQLLPLDTLQEYFNRQAWVNGDFVSSATPTRDINAYPVSSYKGSLPFDYLTSCRNAGLCTKCYLPDINSTFIGSAQYQKVIAESIVKVTNNTVNMQDVLVAQRLYNYFQKLAAVGARFDEYIRAEYGIDIRKYLDIPTFLRTWSFPVTFDDVVSHNAFSPDSSDGLGQLAGRGYGMHPFREEDYNKGRMSISVDEPSQIIFLMTIEPLPVYSQGIDFTLLNNQFDDIYTPSLDRMGMQPVFMSQVESTLAYKNVLEQAQNDAAAAFTSPDPFKLVLGYVPAWQEYKVRAGRVMGNFAGSLSHWVLLRDASETIPVAPGVTNKWVPEYTNYIIPSMFNSPFQDTTEDGNPFQCQFNFDVIVKSPMSAASMTGFAEGSL